MWTVSARDFAIKSMLLLTLLSLASWLTAQVHVSRGAIGSWQRLGSAHVDG